MFPKVLILNQPFDNKTGGGITLSNLFDRWPKDNLKVACPSQLILPYTNFEMCKEYYQLGHLEQKWIFPFNYLRAKSKSGSKFKTKIDFEQIPDSKTFSTFSLKKTLIEKLFLPFIHYSGVINFIYKIDVSKNFFKWVNNFNPDLIYAQAQSLQEVVFCRKLHEATGIPMVFHMMDDWVTLSSQSKISQALWKRKVKFEFEKLLQQCDSLLTISEYMAKEYHKRYGIKSQAFHNPVDIKFWGNEEMLKIYVDDSPIILYAGRVGLGIDDSLISLANAVESLNSDFDSKIKFHIQSERPPSWITKFDCVIHKSFGPYKDLPKIFSQADLLYLPYDFSDDSIQFIKYSMPTKASEYMISGTPIFILAPKDTAIVEYAQRENWAVTLTSNKIEDIKLKLKEILYNNTLRETVSIQARRICLSNHEKNVVQEKFYKELMNSCKTH
ncbi:glycosyltransferase [Belliella sp. DSM 107340]|uniref:Glycosyltransferase n=1 Tax=Belliella calami TaxID=2923436 RepID=A0ABS9UPS2_9BACT|nr:glycosyltransferase [Belliella calami]MCH7398627.1 glycosyltransferase [Belliella calami]